MSPINLVRVCIFSAAFVVSAAASFGLIKLPGVDLVAVSLARLAGLTLGALGVQASLDGPIIAMDGFVAIVVAQCTALEIILLFSAAVAVCPVALKSRILALLLGAPALCALNFVRVISLLFIGANFPQHFDMAHLFVWNATMALAMLAIWLLWFSWAFKRKETTPVASPHVNVR